MTRVYKAPESYPKLGDGELYIFLAGSIEMGNAEDWQSKVTEYVQKNHPEAHILNPRRDDWDSSWEQTIENEQFREQVEWELNALEDADVIVMYFDPNTKSPISLLELGLHANTGKSMVVCCPDGFWRKGNVEVVCNKYGILLVNTMEELIDSL